MNTTHWFARSAEIPAYAQLQRQIHEALLAQHPDWIESGGDSPKCDDYDRRFAELLVRSLPMQLAERNWGNSNPPQFASVSHVRMVHQVQ